MQATDTVGALRTWVSRKVRRAPGEFQLINEATKRPMPEDDVTIEALGSPLTVRVVLPGEKGPDVQSRWFGWFWQGWEYLRDMSPFADARGDPGDFWRATPRRPPPPPAQGRPTNRRIHYFQSEEGKRDDEDEFDNGNNTATL
jgi:hypothetical protein